MQDGDLRVYLEKFMNTLDFFLLNWSDVPILRAGSISSAEINTATRHTRSPQADHLQDQAQRKQAVLRRCSAEGTQASSSSTARIPAATHTAALMQRGHLAAPSQPAPQSHPKLSSHTPTSLSLLKYSSLNASNSQRSQCVLWIHSQFS